MSLEAIGKRVGKHESTVSYWLKKHGLEAARAEKHAAKGAPWKYAFVREGCGYYRCRREGSA